MSDTQELKNERERSYEHDLKEFKKAIETHSSLIDCWWGELYGSINMAEISDGLITHEQAEYLRRKYLWNQIRD